MLVDHQQFVPHLRQNIGVKSGADQSEFFLFGRNFPGGVSGQFRRNFRLPFPKRPALPFPGIRGFRVVVGRLFSARKLRKQLRSAGRPLLPFRPFFFRQRETAESRYASFVLRFRGYRRFLILRREGILFGFFLFLSGHFLHNILKNKGQIVKRDLRHLIGLGLFGDFRSIRLFFGSGGTGKDSDLLRFSVGNTVVNRRKAIERRYSLFLYVLFLHRKLRTGGVAEQRIPYRQIHGVKNHLFIGEFHFQLGGMYIHIHQSRVKDNIQNATGKFFTFHEGRKRLLQRRCCRAGLHISAVDKEVLIIPVYPHIVRLADVSENLHSLAFSLYGNRFFGKVSAQQGINGVVQLFVAGGLKLQRAVACEPEGHLRMSERFLFHHGGHRHSFRAILFQKLSSGRHIGKKLLHEHRGSLFASGIRHLGNPAAGALNPRAHRLPFGAGEQFDLRNRRNGRKSFPPEAQGPDSVQILGFFDLAGCMP